MLTISCTFLLFAFTLAPFFSLPLSLTHAHAQSQSNFPSQFSGSVQNVERDKFPSFHSFPSVKLYCLINYSVSLPRAHISSAHLDCGAVLWHKEVLNITTIVIWTRQMVLIEPDPRLTMGGDRITYTLIVCKWLYWYHKEILSNEHIKVHRWFCYYKMRHCRHLRFVRNQGLTEVQSVFLLWLCLQQKQTPAAFHIAMVELRSPLNWIHYCIALADYVYESHSTVLNFKVVFK